jgi:hypothetical protein
MLPEKSGASNMSVLKETAAAVVGVYALLLACDAMFCAGNARFDDDYYRASYYAPQPGEFRFASDTTPATRVSDSFAQFAPISGKPGKRYSSLTTIIR